MNVRSPRAAVRLAATGVAVAALGLTALQPASAATAKPTAKTTAKTAATAKTTAKAKAAAKAKTPACSGNSMKVTVRKVSRPVNHLLLVATNTSKKTCAAYQAPYLRFDQAQSATQFYAKSRPHAVVLLKPGKSAYAGIKTSAGNGKGKHAHYTRKLGVMFSNAKQTGNVGKALNAKLPGGKVWTDDSAFVTYWQGKSADALKW
ncbi:DUF4232 domain-containing protein [Streptomyces sp. NPDC092296]|uniref:DUF4232 domain-containing protein n=1 Tax=Streptomyces sp. NPDC092296 TaxID=3366012 RepID=UPI0037F4A404